MFGALLDSCLFPRELFSPNNFDCFHVARILGPDFKLTAYSCATIGRCRQVVKNSLIGTLLGNYLSADFLCKNFCQIAKSLDFQALEVLCHVHVDVWHNYVNHCGDFEII